MSIAKEVAAALIKEDCYINVWNRPDKWVVMSDGKRIPAYLSVRRLISRPAGRLLIENYLSLAANDLVRDYAINMIAGLATAGITWAHAVASQLLLPMCYVRSVGKGYGENKHIEGNPSADSKALIVDDTFFTGEAIERASHSLVTECDITAVSALTIVSLNPLDRINGTDFAIKSLTTYKEIVEKAFTEGIFNERQRASMIEYYEHSDKYEFKQGNRNA